MTPVQKLAQDIDVIQQQEAQKRREIDELRASEGRFSDTLKLLSREVELAKSLQSARRPRNRDAARRPAGDMRGQLSVVQATIVKTETAIQETQSRIAGTRAGFVAQAEEDLAKSRADLAVLDENIKFAQDKVRRTELKAPVRGIVNKLNITTIGAVVQPAANLMELVPIDDTLLEGRI
jgi:adhesin transport system membrane fusion protein